MKLTFDYYHNLENIDLRLCNPDERELFPLPGKNRNLVLRFNDLSELTFDVYSSTTLSDGTVVDLEAYDYIRTKRLVYATNIGWFQIANVTEEDDGKCKYKSVTAQSYQSIFKNKGFMSEERVYCFYNPNDPYDDRYDSKQADSIPSVLGQMYKQLGIKQALSQGQEEPAIPYEDWTITYIPSSLIYGGANSVCRTFKENATFGYDWMVNDVEEAFEVIVLFDFMYKTIHVRLPNSVSEKADVLYTFNGLMKSVEVSEDADDIVTVLNCNGDNCDITAVNPTGANYICDFSYYMDKVNHRWMSAELIAKLERWKADCDAEKQSYESLIQRLRGYYKNQTECKTDLQAASLSLQNLKNAQAERGVLGSGTAGNLCGTEVVENVKSGKSSLETASEYCKSPFSGSAVVTAYQNAPTFDENTGGWQFSGASKSGTADSIVADNMASNGSSATTYWYFSDVSDRSSYCKLKSRASVNKDSPSVSYSCDGFDRYIAYRYPMIQEGSGTIVYCDDIHVWISRWEQVVAALNSKNTSLQVNIDATNSSLSVITNKLNILSYFSNTPTLLRELNCYWIEGDYTNDHIAVLDETTPEEEIDLSNELLSSGYAELSKVCQPRFSFSLESINATKVYEFREQMRALELGKVITIEKEEGLWYYPALLEISISLDDSDIFNMTFANATRLDDWGYTYADLISTSSSTSRQVSANWQNITAYAKEKEKISSLIKEPLDTTLRASFANMVNQEFTVDKNGILGRKRLSVESDAFEKEQMRLLNNTLIFTDDEWETAKTALGKVYYTDDNGRLATAYGLIAETIIGSLIMGEKLQIKNKNSTVEIGADGISILGVRDDGTKDVVFSAKTDGALKINVAASKDIASGTTHSFSYDERGNLILSYQGEQPGYFINSNGDLILTYANDKPDIWSDENGYVLTSDESFVSSFAHGALSTTIDAGGTWESKFKIDDQVVSSLYFDFANNRFVFDGHVVAGSGEIGKCRIVDGKLQVPAANVNGTLNAAVIALPKSLSATPIVDGTTLSGEGLTVGSVADGEREYNYGMQVRPDGIYALKSADGWKCIIENGGTIGGLAGYLVDGWTFDTLAPAGLAYWFGGDFDNDGDPTLGYFTGHFKIAKSLLVGEIGRPDKIDTADMGKRLKFSTDEIALLYGENTPYKITLEPTYGEFIGTWRTNGSAWISSSDARLKNTIEDFTDEHDILFDNLHPRTYKWNDGTSDRTHSGFIAQEVVEAVEKAGLTTKDFAAVVNFLDEDGNDDGWGLRYEELISINTWQIQTLKARVAELERKLYAVN